MSDARETNIFTHMSNGQMSFYGHTTGPSFVVIYPFRRIIESRTTQLSLFTVILLRGRLMNQIIDARRPRNCVFTVNKSEKSNHFYETRALSMLYDAADVKKRTTTLCVYSYGTSLCYKESQIQTCSVSVTRTGISNINPWSHFLLHDVTHSIEISSENGIVVFVW